MIKIKINKTNNKYSSLIVSGHSNYDEIGKDIVCAGVSAILIGALNWFDLESKIVHQENLIQVITSQYNYLDLIKTQLQAIQKKYSQYICIELQEKKLSSN